MRARLWTCALSLLLAAPALAGAQAVTGSHEGRILSSQGEPLERAVVTVSGPFLLGTREATTDARGHFLLLWLPAGSYTVQSRALGFGPVALRDVRVSLGATGSLGDVRLAPQAVELAEIVVSGARPLIDPTTAAAATRPAGEPESLWRRDERRRRHGPRERLLVDGIHVTEISVGAGSVDLPYNFVREVQVTTGGYEAEFGRTQGGVVNVITNSGGTSGTGRSWASSPTTSCGPRRAWALARPRWTSSPSTTSASASGGRFAGTASGSTRRTIRPSMAVT